MVKESGVFYTKTHQERELEKRVKERKQELMEIYRAQREQRQEAKASKHPKESKAQSRSEGEEEYATSADRRKGKNGMEDNVDVSHAHHTLYSDQESASGYVREVTTKAASRLDSGKTWHHFLYLGFVLGVPEKNQNISHISI